MGAAVGGSPSVWIAFKILLSDPERRDKTPVEYIESKPIMRIIASFFTTNALYFCFKVFEFFKR